MTIRHRSSHLFDFKDPDYAVMALLGALSEPSDGRYSGRLPSFRRGQPIP
jgi:hypothetical protein